MRFFVLRNKDQDILKNIWNYGCFCENSISPRPFILGTGIQLRSVIRLLCRRRVVIVTGTIIFITVVIVVVIVVVSIVVPWRFLVACTRLYKSLCRTVCLSVSRSVCLSVGRFVITLFSIAFFRSFRPVLMYRRVFCTFLRLLYISETSVHFWGFHTFLRL